MAIKELLMDALKEATALFNKNGDPDSSIIKVAQTRDFNPDQTQRLIEIFNTVNALSHYKNAMDKTAAFPLANSNNIIVTLFDPEKMAFHTNDVDFYDYSEYMYPENCIEVEAEAVDEPRPTFDDRNLETVLHSGYKAADALRRIANNCESNAGMAEIVIGKEMDKLSAVIRQEWQEKGNLRYSELVKCAYSVYGEAVVPYLQILESCLPNNKLVKCARIIDDRKYSFPLSKLGELIKLGQDAEDLRKEAASIEEEVRSFEKEILNSFKPEYSTIDFFKDAAGSKGGGNSGNRKNQQDKDESKDRGKSILGIIPQAIGQAHSAVSPTIKTIQERTNKDIADTLATSLMADETRAAKRHEEEMANLERQAILEDLITNDPVLSGIEPEKIVSGYQAIMRLSPEVSRNKEVVRAQLRQLAHSIALSPFDAKQLVDLEGVIRRNAAPIVSPKELKV